MNLVHSARRWAAAASAATLLALAQPAAAQDISDSHIAAARGAISSLGVTQQFDEILPQAAAALKGELIQKNPDLQSQIITIVDETTLSLVSRRGDLEREAAMAYARVFSEEHLTAISTFFTSEAGRKLITDGPIADREIFQAANIWQSGVARDLAQQVATRLQEVAPQAQGPAEAEAEAGN